MFNRNRTSLPAFADLPPETQSAITDIMREAQENHERLSRLSFIYRHQGGIFAAGYLLIITMVAALLIDGYQENAMWRMWLYLAMGYSGILLVFMSFLRETTKTFAGMMLKIFVMLAILFTIAAPMYIGMVFALKHFAS